MAERTWSCDGTRRPIVRTLRAVSTSSLLSTRCRKAATEPALAEQAGEAHGAGLEDRVAAAMGLMLGEVLAGTFFLLLADAGGSSCERARA